MRRKFFLILASCVLIVTLAALFALWRTGKLKIGADETTQTNQQIYCSGTMVCVQLTKELADYVKNPPAPTRAAGTQKSDNDKKIDQLTNDALQKQFANQPQPAAQSNPATRATGDTQQNQQQFQDAIIILLDENKQPILPNAQKLKGKTTTRATESKDLTLVWDTQSKWPSDIDVFKKELDNIYQKIKDIYGEPFFNNQILITNRFPSTDFSGYGASYDLTLNEINVRFDPQSQYNAYGKDYLSIMSHELIHAFRDDFILPNIWEEGMAKRIEYYIISYLDDPSLRVTDSFSEDYEYYNNPTHPYLNSRNMDYYMGATIWNKIFIEKDTFFKEFNQMVFNANSNNNLYSYWRSSQGQIDLINFTKSIVKEVEGKPIDQWIDEQSQLNRNVIGLIPFFDVSPGNSPSELDGFTVLESGSYDPNWNYYPTTKQTAKELKNIDISVLDENGNKIIDKKYDNTFINKSPYSIPIYSGVTSILQNLPAYKAPRSSSKRFILHAQVDVGDQTIMLKKPSCAFKAYSYDPRRKEGIAGLVEGEQKGTVIIKNSSSSITVNVENGCFDSVESSNYFTNNPGKYELEFTSTSGKKYLKTINKLAGFYLVYIPTDENSLLSTQSVSGINGETFSWQTSKDVISKTVFEDTDGKKTSSNWTYGINHQISLNNLLAPNQDYDYQIIMIDEWGRFEASAKTKIATPATLIDQIKPTIYHDSLTDSYAYYIGNVQNQTYSPNDDLIINARVADNIEVKEVLLYFRPFLLSLAQQSNYSGWNSVKMEKKDFRNYYGVIPKSYYTKNQDIQYYIKAVDSSGNINYSPILYDEGSRCGYNRMNSCNYAYLNWNVATTTTTTTTTIPQKSSYDLLSDKFKSVWAATHQKPEDTGKSCVAGYDPIADFNKDKIIDIKDASFLIDLNLKKDENESKKYLEDTTNPCAITSSTTTTAAGRAVMTKPPTTTKLTTPTTKPPTTTKLTTTTTRPRMTTTTKPPKPRICSTFLARLFRACR